MFELPRILEEPLVCDNDDTEEPRFLDDVFVPCLPVEDVCDDDPRVLVLEFLTEEIDPSELIDPGVLEKPEV